MASKIEIVCEKNNISYKDVRGAMVQGARDVFELKEMAGVCGKCDSCKEHLGYITSTLCGCKEVKMETVQDLIKDGVRDLDSIMEITGAGTGEDCGKCQSLIENMIAQGY